MKFTCNTKPLADALSLVIIPRNVSNFFPKSVAVQLTVEDNSLRVNAVAANLVSEAVVSGSGYEEDEFKSVFVSSLMFKQLVSTFEASTTTFNFVENAVVVTSGKSKFTFPDVSPVENMNFTRPNSTSIMEPSNFNKDDWKFIKDHQMYALAMTFTKPAYSRVWVGDSGDVLAGDFDNNIFTHSKRNKLNTTCLLSDTIINLFNAVPDNSTLGKLEDRFIIRSSTDGFKFIAEISPEYEEVVGSYNSEIVMSAFCIDPEHALSVDLGELRKFLGQADILSTGSEWAIEMKLSGDTLSIMNETIDFSAPVQRTNVDSFSASFLAKSLKSVISKLDEDKAMICPMFDDETQTKVIGATIWTTNLSAVLSSLDTTA